MRVCPECGYVDPPEWKNTRWQLYTEYMTFEDFQTLYPNQAAALKENPKLVTDDVNGYHLTKSGHVHRVPKYLCINGKFYHGSSTTEKPKDPFQQKLESENR